MDKGTWQYIMEIQSNNRATNICIANFWGQVGILPGGILLGIVMFTMKLKKGNYVKKIHEFDGCNVYKETYKLYPDL